MACYTILGSGPGPDGAVVVVVGMAPVPGSDSLHDKSEVGVDNMNDPNSVSIV